MEEGGGGVLTKPVINRLMIRLRHLSMELILTDNSMPGIGKTNHASR